MQKIKTIIIVMTILVGLGSQKTFSQTENVSSSSIGLEDITFSFRGGLGLSNLAGPTEGFDYSSNIAILLGVYGEYLVKSKSGLLGGIEYASKGATIKTEGNFLYNNLRYDISYINLVLGGFHDLAPRLRVEAAVVPALKISEELSYTWVYGYQSLTAATDDVRAADLGVMAGFNYQFTKINFGVHYTYGLMDINKDQSAGIASLQNRMLMFSLKYVLDI